MKKFLSRIFLILSVTLIMCLPMAASAATQYVKLAGGPGNTVNVRMKPSTSATIVSTLTHGSQVTVSSSSNGWSKVTFHEYNSRHVFGTGTGYIKNDFLSSTIPSDTLWIARYGSAAIKTSNTHSNGCALLQKDLKRCPIDLADDFEVDGYCGTKTVNAIKEFQKLACITADGIAGNLTKEMLYKFVKP